MFSRAHTLAALAALLLLTAAVAGNAQIVIPTQQCEHLDFQLQSLGNNITLYFGDPQQLLMLKFRPDRLKPRVDYSSQAQAVLRIRDLCLVQQERPNSESSRAEPPTKSDNESQTWEIRLSPSSPTSFALQCDQGENTFDFDDFQVQKVDIQAAGAKVDVSFSSQNAIDMDTFNANVPKGTLQFKGMLNARAKEVTLVVPEAICHLDLTGKQFEGESAITFHGVPAEMHLVVSRKIGLRVTAPAPIAARFQAPHMTQSGEEWMSRDYEQAKCRVRLVFSEDVPVLDVRWH